MCSRRVTVTVSVTILKVLAPDRVSQVVYVKSIKTSKASLLKVSFLYQH